MIRYRTTGAPAVGATLACTATAGAHGALSFPMYGKDESLGNGNELTRPLFKTDFDQVTRENAGTWGSTTGTTRTAAITFTLSTTTP
jgi:hypothetical protein